MTTPRRSGRTYKEVTLQQLRSFCETARNGSFLKAAAAMGLAHPTVWKQVHDLERAFGTKLVEPFGRGCRLTSAGRVLAQLAAPNLAGIDSLRRQFQEALRQVAPRLVVATAPRILTEDLPACVVEFESLRPEVRLTFKEFLHTDVAAEVESGDADLGVVLQDSWDRDNVRIAFEPAYDLDLLLITPPDHPLARRRHVRPEDLRAFPLVNSRNSFNDPLLTARLEQLGLFETQPRRVEGSFTATIRRYVELGFGIGLVPGTLSRTPPPGLHERSMSRYFGRETVYLLWRKGVMPSDAARGFAETVKTMLGPRPK